MGKGKRFFIETYGCEMNKSDSLDIAVSLERQGYVRTSDALEADVVVINTCSVRRHAEQRVYGRLGYYRGLKKSGRKDRAIVLAGCMAQRLGREAQRRFPEIAVVAGTSHNLRIPLYLSEYQNTKIPVAKTKLGGYEFSRPEDRRPEGHHAWVTIIKGCSNYCSYCIVPYVRGPELSKPSGDITAEVDALVDRGVTEITLLGQNVNAYGKDSGDISFADLLERLDHISGLRWIRFLTSHPKDFDVDVIRRISGLGKVCRHFHLPLQSGSDRVLSLMNRGYSIRHYMSIVEALNRFVGDFAITTDIIVGFPTETDEDFKKTLSVYEEVGFDDAFTYRYSKRPHIAAGALDGEVDPAVAQDRLERLIDVVRRTEDEKNRSLLGEECEVLVVKKSRKNPSEFLAKTEHGKLVACRPTGGRPTADAPAFGPGSFIRVRIEGISGKTLRGSEVLRRYALSD
ncbi:MAG: tRNA (N6-isopentenyl adenosine(37)-C2)-methylthiotransferase MiaB [Spirochaetes bacterium]|nr:tRNA (N6-isopentenyl adenosine(37)-C2)-methylthiotransferase MiaB [Spirochaetota bacterium]